MTDPQRLANAFKALSNPNRLQIYLEILQRRQLDSKNIHGCALGDFIRSLNIGAPTVSHHIKELVNAGLIRVERNGKFITCHLDETMCAQLQGFFATHGQQQENS